jgi:5'-deoxynucleotidase YfbR-like HD superfamily hydrolase
VKNPDSATDHSFRIALMVWLFTKGKKLNIEKALKMALIHDICKILTGDITPYDGLLPKSKKERDEFVRRWRRLSLREKEKRYAEKFEKEYAA